MIRQQLVVIGAKSSIYIALVVFFVVCIIGYTSNLDIETLVQKAVIAGCLTGLTSYLLVRLVVKHVPENIKMIDGETNKDGERDGS